MTSATGRSSGCPASATRLSTSVCVKMPVGRPPPSVRTMEPIRRDFMSSSTWRTLADSGSVTGACRIALRKGEAMVSSSAARLEYASRVPRVEVASSAARRRVQKAWNSGLLAITSLKRASSRT